MRIILSYLIGAIFGTGIAVAGMANPAKVLNFFDITGHWDPSLGFVMAGALSVTFIGYRLVLPRGVPLFEPKFALPTSRVIDTKLLAGAATFGVGWGITGFCPGGALPAVGTWNPEVWLFVAAMITGMLGSKALAAKFEKAKG